MKLDPILRKATRLAQSGNYEEAAGILEPEKNRYIHSFHYSYLLGICYLHMGDFTGSLEYFRYAHETKKNNPLPLLGFAVLYFRRGEIDKTVDLYLDVQELDKKNRIAKKALNIIRKHARADDFSAINETGRLKSLYPPVPRAGISRNTVIAGGAIAVSLLILFGGILASSKIKLQPLGKRGERRTLTDYVLTPEEKNQPVQSNGTFRYVLTRSEVNNSYKKAQSFFTSYRDEKAKIELNRILESNASSGIKNKSRILLSYMQTPGFDTFNKNDNISYSDAIGDPPLYRDVHVIWRGMAANVTTIQNVTRFDLLVGYDTYKTMEGQVNVVFNSAVPVNTERPLEVLGRIVPTASYGIMLEGVAIHQSGRLINK